MRIIINQLNCILLTVSMLLSLNALSLPYTQDLKETFTPGICVAKGQLSYPISDPKYRYMAKDKPRLSYQNDRISNYCGFMSTFLSGEGASDATKKIEKHEPACTGTACLPTCDRDCDNRFLSELYESYLIKFVLESPELSSKIKAIYQKIFNMFEKDMLNKEFEGWLAAKEPFFPVSQRDRDWSKYSKEFILKNLTGINHDVTTILLGGDLLKQLQHSLPTKFTGIRDYMFNNVLKKLRGYRTNSKKGREGKEEAQIGITSFDFDDLKPEPGYYTLKKWTHWGRSTCDTEPVQGMYQTEAVQKFIPIKCGISGSTNFWIWTALFSGVDMTQDEVRLFLLSAFIVLGADGGHSLMEVLSSATLSAIFMEHYAEYSKDSYLSKIIRSSNFAENLYEVTKDINPIGNRAFDCIDFDKIADSIYRQDRYPPFNDVKDPNDIEKEHRKELEAFFLMENNRYLKPFGDYASFLDKMPELDDVRQRVAEKLKRYVVDYCKP